MRKLQYSKLLLSMIMRKIYIPILFVVVMITTLSLYIISTNGQNNIYDNAINKGDIHTGLSSNTMNLVAVFIIYVLFLSMLSWTIFKENLDNGSELLFISRGSSRVSIVMQKYLILSAVIIFSSIIMLPIFLGVAWSDKILSAQDKVKWVFSMFVGMIIVGFCIGSFASILLAIMNVLPAIALTSIIFMSFPIITASLPKDNTIKPLISHINGNGLEIISDETMDQNEKVYPHLSDEKQITYNKTGTLVDVSSAVFNGKMNVIKIGSKKMTSSYDKYCKYDSWRTMSSLFDVFNSNNSTNDIMCSWTEDTKLRNILNIEYGTDIEIHGKKYIRLISKWEGQEVAKSTISGGSFLKLAKVRYQFSQMGLNDEDRVKISEFQNFLRTDNDAAREYKELSFVGQSSLFRRYTQLDNPESYIHRNVSAKDAFNEIMHGTSNWRGFYRNPQAVSEYAWNDFTDKTSYAGSLSHVFANTLIKENKERFEPDSMYPNVPVNPLIINSREALSDLKHGGYLGFYDEDGLWSMPHYNTYHEHSTGMMAFWLIFMFSSPFISLLIYLRKDVK